MDREQVELQDVNRMMEQAVEVIDKIYTYCCIDLNNESPFNDNGLVDCSTVVGDQILRTPCKDVPPDLNLLGGLNEVLLLALREHRKLSGIHMLHLGFNLNAFVLKDMFETTVMFNPVIKETSQETYDSVETNPGICAGMKRFLIKRPKIVTIEWKNLDNDLMTGVYYMPSKLQTELITAGQIHQYVDQSHGILLSDKGIEI